MPTDALIAELLVAAPNLRSAGYIKEITVEELADYLLEAQFAALDADEPGGAASWTPEECNLFFTATKLKLMAHGVQQ